MKYSISLIVVFFWSCILLSGCEDPKLPEDPGSVAPIPALAETEYTSMLDATSFLYTGNKPIQTGVAAGTIEEKRVAVIRGQILNRDNKPLSGVTVSIQDHTEYGQTISRADGGFDLVVNGGGKLVINYHKPGYLPLQRQLQTPWEDYVIADDVVMLALDSQVSSIKLNNTTTLQIAQGSEQVDADGTRQATVLFPAGTTATMTLPDGTTQSLSNINVRATEYTVGANGPQAMPGDLPTNSGYTYAVELSVDEAINAEASQVSFNQPLPVYVDNFLNFPTGEAVPLGWYDPERAAWIAADNGRVIEILNISSDGKAELDLDGNGNAADGEALTLLGISDSELTYLADTYRVGKTLWRVQVEHFTPWDCNWPYGPPADAEFPPDGLLSDELNTEDCDVCQGSIVTPQGQILGESIPLPGTDVSLEYSSKRALGYQQAVLDIPLTGDSVPGSLNSVELVISIAGKKFVETFDRVSVNQSYRFEWDGTIAFGRHSKSALAKIEVIYHYTPEYYSSRKEWVNSFNQMPEDTDIIGNRTESTIKLSRKWEQQITRLPPTSQGYSKLGLWNLNIHHSFDPNFNKLYLGSGAEFSAMGQSGRQLSVVVGRTDVFSIGYGGDNGPADNAQFSVLNDIAFDSKGNMYLSDSDNYRIRRVNRDGIVETVAGNGISKFSGDGGPATEASINYSSGITVDDNDNLLIADLFAGVVRKVTQDGLINTIAGVPHPDTEVNKHSLIPASGGMALDQVLSPSSLAISPDNELYVADYLISGIYKIDQEGRIFTVLGSDSVDYVDGGPAIKKELDIFDMKFSEDGTLFIAAEQGGYQLSPTGKLSQIIDQRRVMATAIDRNGSVYFAVSDGGLRDGEISDVIVKIVDKEAAIVAGNGKRYVDINSSIFANNRHFDVLGCLGFGVDNAMYACDLQNVNKIETKQILPDYSDEWIVPDPSGKLIYVFSPTGRHLRTLDVLTGNTLYDFSYDNRGFLASVTDINGEITLIERDADGNPTAILAPNGQHMSLTVNSDGLLASVSNPNAETYQMSYTSDGLLASFHKPSGSTSNLIYDDDGRLISDTNALGGGWRLDRNSDLITMTSGEGRDYTFKINKTVAGDIQKINTLPDGTQLSTEIAATGITTTTDASGMITIVEGASDPLFGVSSPYSAMTEIKTPSGLSKRIYTSKTVIGADDDDLLKFQQLKETFTFNAEYSWKSDSYVRVYDTETRTWTSTTPEGATSTTILDDKGRVIQQQIADFDASHQIYDNRGRLSEVSLGDDASRKMTLNYDDYGFLASVTDAKNRSVRYINDPVGRITQQTNPDGKSIQYEYSANGNLTQLTLASGEVHQFNYTALDQQDIYTPPAADANATEGGIGTLYPATQYSYNLDKQLTKVTRPDGQTIDYLYGNDSGRLLSVSTREGQYVYGYYGDIAPEKNTGQIKTVTSPQGINTTYSYDGSLLTQIKQDGEVSGSIAYHYNNVFLPDSQIVNGDSLSLSYNNDSQLQTAGAMSLEYQYGSGLLESTTLNTINTTQSYNNFGELDTYTAQSDDDELYSYSLSRDAMGLIIGKTETVNSEETVYRYEYNILDQLSKVYKDDLFVESYRYDTNGNRIGDINGKTGRYDSQDRLLSYGNISYTYGANGELKSKTENGKTITYYYDVFSNLLEVTLADGAEIKYLIDGQNRRIGKKVNGELTQGFLYQGQLNPVAELDKDGNIVARFVYGDKRNVPSYMIKDGTDYRIISDHLGSVRLVINANTGDVAQRMDYDSFGNITSDTKPGFQPFGFAGGIYDQHTKLTRFGARDYDAEIGRWTAKDPIGFGGGANFYAYVSSNPINLIDPTGFEFMFSFDLLSARDEAKNEHYNRNQLNHHPCSEQSALEQGWTRLEADKSIYHTMGAGNENNSKWVSPDGHYEGVFDGDGNPVTDPAVMATYNYQSPTENPIGHVMEDVLPYYFLGNSPDDPTTFGERLTAGYQGQTDAN
jgi:RHS repeat-associated protein